MTISTDFCPTIKEDEATRLAQDIALGYKFGKRLDAIAQTCGKRCQHFWG